MKARIVRLLTALVSVLAVFIAVSTSASACPFFFFHQPKAPKSLIIKD